MRVTTVYHLRMNKPLSAVGDNAEDIESVQPLGTHPEEVNDRQDKVR